MYDEIVVGAGSAGAILAARLSEDAGRKVLLIEAGPDYVSLNSTPENIRSGLRPARDHDWGYSAEMVEGRMAPYARAKLTGGCSAVNACLALRGIPDDYDEWRDLGNSEWSWYHVQTVFRDLEQDADFENEHHGRSGPTLVRRFRKDSLTPAQLAFYDALVQLGAPETEDHNHPSSTGVGTGPWNIGLDDVRLSTSITYLHSARSRPNLTIRSNSHVHRLLFDGGRAVGIEVEGPTGPERVIGKRVTLSAGAIGSPLILLRSGIGPPEDLRAAGIEPRVGLAGVGKNLIDHASVAIGWAAPDGVVEENSPYLQTLYRFTAPGSALQNDMQSMLFQALPQPALSLRVMLMKPLSQGSLKLKSADPMDGPDIRLNLTSAPEDAHRMRDGVRFLGRLLRSPAMTALGAAAFMLADGTMMSSEELHRSLGDEQWVTDYVHRAVNHYVHPVGSCRMGPAIDPLAVVDQHGRVHGISGLRVVDASVMPTIPRANTNFPTIMIAERMAFWMRKETD